jgi:hypothetical protein
MLQTSHTRDPARTFVGFPTTMLSGEDVGTIFRDTTPPVRDWRSAGSTKRCTWRRHMSRRARGSFRATDRQLAVAKGSGLDVLGIKRGVRGRRTR